MGPCHQRVCGARDAALCPSTTGRVAPGWTQDTDGRRALSADRREEIEAGARGSRGQVEAKIGVAESDGDAGEDALVDLGLAGADQAAQLVGAVAYQRAPLIVVGVRTADRLSP